MALPILPNASNFLGVGLVINRSRDGPRFVFHYPPHIKPAHGRRSKSAEEEDGEDEDDFLLERSARSMPKPSDRPRWNQDDHVVTESGTQVVPWEHVAGFPTKDLENILTPARAYHKRLFQVSLDPLYCVSYPIHVPVNGVWKKKKSREKSKSKKREEGSVSAAAADPEETPQSGDNPISDADQIEVRDMAKPAVGKNGDEGEDKKSSMTMFNLVFFLNPTKHESKDLVDVLYSQIIKKVNKAYKYCQQRSDFVWKESKRILALKDKAREESKFFHILAGGPKIGNRSLARSSLTDLVQRGN